MSIAATVARVGEIEAMLGKAAAAPAADPAVTSFQQQLQQASASGPGLSAALAAANAGARVALLDEYARLDVLDPSKLPSLAVQIWDAIERKLRPKSDVMYRYGVKSFARWPSNAT